MKDIVGLTSRIIKESNLKVTTIANQSGVVSQTIHHWCREKPSDALVQNINAVLNVCGYELAVVRKCEVNNAETREQQRLS
jgi:hypothetical protein